MELLSSFLNLNSSRFNKKIVKWKRFLRLKKLSKL